DTLLHSTPRLNADGLSGAVRYFDALTNDARLVLDTLRSAANSGASLVNYLRFKGAQRADGRWLCELEDVLAGKNVLVRAGAVVNATGPWAQGLPHSHVQLRLTKGIHLVLDHS